MKIAAPLKELVLGSVYREVAVNVLTTPGVSFH